MNNSHTQQKVRRATNKVDSEKKTTLPAVGIREVFLEEVAFEVSLKRSVGFVREELNSEKWK